MSIASSLIQPDFSRLSVNERPSLIHVRTPALACLKPRFVIDSLAISADSGSVMPPASRVARLRVNWAIVIWRTVSPAIGAFKIQLSMTNLPLGVFRQYRIKLVRAAIVGIMQVRLELMKLEMPTTTSGNVGMS